MQGKVKRKLVCADSKNLQIQNLNNRLKLDKSTIKNLNQEKINNNISQAVVLLAKYQVLADADTDS